MGYLEALTANSFRTDAEGRLILVPFRRRRGYVVPPERAAAFTRAQRRFWLLLFLAIPASALVFRSAMALLIVGLLGLVVYLGALWLFTRTLEPAPEVPVISRAEAVARVTHAMGARTAGVIALGSGMLALGGVALLAAGLRAWGVWGLTAYFTLVAVLYARQWRRLTLR